MNVRFFVLLEALLGGFACAWADSTVNPVNAYSWGANTGWVNWRADGINGASIGEYVCSGYIYSANVGWINLGSGRPVNGIRYQNNSSVDFGVNLSVDPAQPCYGLLRGYAYGANIGWINFERQGNARVKLCDGAMSGFAYSANCGWINLDDLHGHYVQTDSIAKGADTDGNGLADAWEYTFFGHTGVDPNGDADGTGQTNLFKYLAGLDPLDGSRFILTINTITGQPTERSLSFGPIACFRSYVIEFAPILGNESWSALATGSSPVDVDTTRTVVDTAAVGNQRFYRVTISHP